MSLSDECRCGKSVNKAPMVQRAYAIEGLGMTIRLDNKSGQGKAVKTKPLLQQSDELCYDHRKYMRISLYWIWRGCE